MTFFLSMKSNSIRVWKQKDELFAILQMNIFITKCMAFMLSKGLVVSEMIVCIQNKHASIKDQATCISEVKFTSWFVGQILSL